MGEHLPAHATRLPPHREARGTVCHLPGGIHGTTAAAGRGNINTWICVLRLCGAERGCRCTGRARARARARAFEVVGLRACVPCESRQLYSRRGGGVLILAWCCRGGVSIRISRQGLLGVPLVVLQ